MPLQPAINNFVQSLTVANSAFSNNTANAGSAGGVHNQGGGTTLINSTLSGNSEAVGTTNGTITLKNSIVANSTGSNCTGSITDGGNNIQFGGTAANSCGGTIPTADPARDAHRQSGIFPAEQRQRSHRRRQQYSLRGFAGKQ